MTGWKLALASTLAIAAAPLLEAGPSGAQGRHPGPSSSSSAKSSSSSGSSSSSSSSGSATVHSSGATQRHISGARARHPRPTPDGRSSYWGGGWCSYCTVPDYYPPYYHGWRSAYYPYWGYYDGFYYGYYGWPAPYGPVHVYGDNVGAVRVMVHPSDAEVYVDGYYAGVVDDFDGFFQRLNVKAGRHELTLKREGYKTHRVRLYVPVGGTVKVRHRLEEGVSREVTETEIGDPDTEAMVADAVDDAMVGDDDRGPQSVPAPSGSGDPLAPGRVVVRIRPSDASVYVDGEFEGTAEQVEALELPAGTHRVEAVRPGYLTSEQEVVVESGKTVPIEVSLQRTSAK